MKLVQFICSKIKLISFQIFIGIENLYMYANHPIYVFISIEIAETGYIIEML